MAKQKGIWKPLLVALSLGATIGVGMTAAMAHGGGHCGGGHCGGGHFGGGAHFGGGSHFSGSHFSSCHFSSGHIGSTHISTSHVAAAHNTINCEPRTNCSTGHGFSLFGHSHRMANLENMTGNRTPLMPHNEMHLQAMEGQSPSPYCSSVVRPQEHAGFFGHMHRLFAGKPCELQNIHTEIMPVAFTQIQCATAPVACRYHQIFARENLALNQIASQTSYLRANAVKVRCFNQLNNNNNFYATQIQDNYFSVNVDNNVYPATDLDAVIQNDNPSDVGVEMMADSNDTPVFSGLSYFLPNPGGILSIYFSYESSINNFLQLHKASFLAAAMHQLI